MNLVIFSPSLTPKHGAMASASHPRPGRQQDPKASFQDENNTPNKTPKAQTTLGVWVKGIVTPHHLIPLAQDNTVALRHRSNEAIS